jgi:four helix bundle protein
MAFVRFEDLRVFKLAEKLCDDIWGIATSWEYFGKNTVGLQLVKSADSIGANIAEGAGRGTPKDNKRFVRISRGSLNETKYWLRRASRRNLISKEQDAYFRRIIEYLSPQLNAYLKSIGRNTKHQTPNTKHETLNTNHQSCPK